MESEKVPSYHPDAVKRDRLFNLEGKVALVTGGGSGIGLMITQALAANGAKVYITGRTKEKLDTVVETYAKDTQGTIIPLPGDIASKDGIRSLFDEFSAKEKYLSILVNNAGVSTKTFETEASSGAEMKKNLFDHADATFEDWENAYRTNVPQIFFMTTAFLPLLENATKTHPNYSGSVINITSISGMVKTSQHHPGYNASKAAAIHLSRMLASELAENGIKVRVNSLAPGVFPSEMTTNDSDEKQKSHIPKEKYEDKVPAGRPGKEEDMGSAILLLVTNQYLNGQNIVIDGGYTLSAGL